MLSHKETDRGHPATSEVEYSEAETEFMMALDKFKRKHRCPFPTCHQVLEILFSLGYRKVADNA